MSLSRREILRGTTAAGIGVLAGKVHGAPVEAAPLRVAHLTDMHVQPERGAGEGYAAALRSLEKLGRRPDLLITGGDHIMDAFDADLDRAKLQWALYDKVLSENTKLPVFPVIGNRDVWAWGEKQKAIPADAAGYGKAMALDRLKLKKPFHSFDQGDWHFICLDNVSRAEFSFVGKLDDEQNEWLKADLAANHSKPICVVSHVPLVSACVFFAGERFADTTYHIPESYLHVNVKPLLLLMRQNNVKVCLSGHIHLVDAVEYLGIKFFCNGAVSGNWWKGNYQGFGEGYGIVDLWPDGSVQNQYMTYGWVAKE